MLQLRKPLSPAESELLLQCLADMEASIAGRSADGGLLKRSAVASARQKLSSQVVDCFYREELANMVFALDSLSRKCSAQLTETLSADEAVCIGQTLRAAAVTRAKLRSTISHTK